VTVREQPVPQLSVQVQVALSSPAEQLVPVAPTGVEQLTPQSAVAEQAQAHSTKNPLHSSADRITTAVRIGFIATS
jgi:hypothetical protein